MKQREILLLSISVFIIIAVWIGFSIYHNSAVSKIPQTTVEKIIPIAPVFDKLTIENIKKKQNIDPIYEVPVSTSSSQQVDEASISEPSDTIDIVIPSTQSGQVFIVQ